MATPTTLRTEDARLRSPQRSVGFVTSFSYDLYEASGKPLLQSWQHVCSRVPLLVAYESLDHLGQLTPQREVLERDGFGLGAYESLTGHDLSLDKGLSSWLTQNADIIPVHLGGQMQPCACPDVQGRHDRHQFGCRSSWMNRNASRWFRKALAWGHAAWALRQSYRALDLGPVRWLFWIDADCTFLEEITPSVAESLFGGADVLHFRHERSASETGIVGFDLAQKGHEFIHAVLGRYHTGAFRAQERWDDCVTTDAVIDTGLYKARDLARDSLQPLTRWRHPGDARPRRKKKPITDVIPHTPIAHYLLHDKGRHGRKLDIMK